MSTAPGYIDPTGTNGPTGVPYDTEPLSLQQQDYVGGNKLGVIVDQPNSVAAIALRQKTLTFNANVNTQISIAHTCKDSEGNPTTPLVYTPLVTSGDGWYFSQTADVTNIYITAPAGATTAVTGTLVVLY